MNATVGDAVGRGTISDDDPTPITIDNVVVKAGKIATFTARLALAPEAPVTVNWGTANGTAEAGTDYTANSGVITFPIGSTSQTIQVTTLSDAAERDEQFYVSLSNATGGAAAPPAPASATIVNRRKGDFNGDGHPDFLWELTDGYPGHADGTLMVWLMEGVTRLATESVSPTAIGSGWNVVGVGDFTDAATRTCCCSTATARCGSGSSRISPARGIRSRSATASSTRSGGSRGRAIRTPMGSPTSSSTIRPPGTLPLADERSDAHGRLRRGDPE